MPFERRGRRKRATLALMQAMLETMHDMNQRMDRIEAELRKWRPPFIPDDNVVPFPGRET